MRKYFSTIDKIKTLLKVFVSSHPQKKYHRFTRQYEWLMLCSHNHMSYFAILFPDIYFEESPTSMAVEYYKHTDTYIVLYSNKRIPMTIDEFIEWVKLTYYDDDIKKFNIALDEMLIGIV